jgi:hypothetical protein
LWSVLGRIRKILQASYVPAGAAVLASIWTISWPSGLIIPVTTQDVLVPAGAVSRFTVIAKCLETHRILCKLLKALKTLHPPAF